MTITYTYGDFLGEADLTLARCSAAALASRNGPLKRTVRAYPQASGVVALSNGWRPDAPAKCWATFSEAAASPNPTNLELV